MEQHSCEQQQSPEPQLCRNNCGFFGNPATLEMCSKCYREYCSRREDEKCKTEEPKKNNAVVEQPTVEPVEEKVEDIIKHRVDDVVPRVEDKVNPPIISRGEAVEQSMDEDEEEPSKPVQKNRSRCFECNKKVGLLGFECRCGYVYCSGHRHAGDGHVCTFDHVSFDRKRLADTMEVVAASKLEKL